MTKGLLISRSTKLKLLKISANNPTAENLSAYRNFRNIFTKTMRASKKMYFEANFTKAKKKPKRHGNSLGKPLARNPKILKFKNY